MWNLLYGDFRKERRPKKKKTKTSDINNKSKRTQKEISEHKSADVSNYVTTIKKIPEITPSIKQPTTNILFKKEVQNVFLNQDVLENLYDKLLQMLGSGLLSADISELKTKRIVKAWHSIAEQGLDLPDFVGKIDFFLSTDKMPVINNFVMVDLDNSNLLFIVKLQSHQFTLLLDSNTTNIGYLISIIKPLIIENYIKSLK